MQIPAILMRARDTVIQGLARYRTSLESRFSINIIGLLIVVMVSTVGVADFGLDRYAHATADHDLTIGARVFERNLAASEGNMRGAADVVAHDFGFRAAFATLDRPTVKSALASLVSRTGSHEAMVVGLDGAVVASPGAPPIDGRAMLQRLNAGQDAGIIIADHALSLAVAAPIELPDLAGWLVLSRPVGRGDLAAFARLSATPIEAEVVPADRLAPALKSVPLDQVAQASGVHGAELVRVAPLPALSAGIAPRLVMHYPLADATSPYRALRYALVTIALIALAGGALISSRLVRAILLPLSGLASATQRMARGEMVRVAVRGSDELASLANNFNAMVDAIEDRERRISHAWLHDALTNLPNRRFFQEQLGAVVARLSPTKRVMVVLLDFDDFKLINDTMGHAVGDAMLRQLADLLPRICPRATVARFGGDEFALLIDDLDSGEDPIRLADDLARQLVTDIQTGGRIIPLSVSFGVAIGPDDGDSGPVLIKHAELALDRAKMAGKRNFTFFEAALDRAVSERRKLEIDLRDALANGELELYFQPLFNPAQAKVKGFEALLRWHHPQRGPVSPAEFIPIAEQSGLIIPISEWVIRQACATAARWPETVGVAVNISPRHFEVPGLIEQVMSALAHSGIAPERLELEITESIFIGNFDETIATLRRLRSLGVRIALDDFGTGYSSLSYLRSFPFDKVKIDQSFVRDISTDASARAIVRAITALAKALGMDTLAEGVEDQAQFDALIEEGCSFIQGYLISRPAPASDIDAILARWGGGEHAGQRAA